MHHLGSARTIFYFRFSAVLILTKGLAGITGVALLVFSTFTYDYYIAKVGAGLLGAGVVLSIVQWLAATSARCPLCQTQLMSRRNCSKHTRARRVLGSYRLPVVATILTKGRFCCPYCHETTELRLRQDGACGNAVSHRHVN
jgi:hypothetical protein